MFPRSLSRGRRRSLLVVIIAFAGGAAVAGWAAIDGSTVADHLRRARDVVEAIPTSGQGLRPDALEDSLARGRSSIRAAARGARSIPLRLVGSIPLAGRSVRALQGIVEAAGLAVDAGAEASQALSAFSDPSGRLTYGMVDGGLALRPWALARPGLQRAAALAVRARQIADRIPTTRVIGQVGQATAQLRRKLSELERTTAYAADASDLVPSMFGGSEHRRYLIVLQNLSEARATGGLVGGFAIIEARGGELSLRQIASDASLGGGSAVADVPMPLWYRTRYDRFASRRLWANVNMEADFRVTAPLVAQLFRRTNGIAVDGVIATDPVALQELVRVTGPVLGPRGITVTGDNLARLLMKDAYALFPESNAVRKPFIAELTTRIYAKLVQHPDGHALVRALGEASRGRHVMVWASSSRDQAALERLNIAGGFPGRGRSFVGVFTQNGSANKMDYYLRRDIAVTVSPKPSGVVRYSMSVRLRNTGPGAGLPKVVLGDDPTLEESAPGQIRSYVSVYVPRSARVGSFSVGGQGVAYEHEVAPHAAILSRFVTIPPRGDAFLAVTWEESPRGLGSAAERDLRFSIISQPTPVPDRVRVTVTAPGFSVRSPDGPPRLPAEDRAQADVELHAVFQRTALGRLRDLLAPPT